jgi:uncharacterized protein with NRDE domain
MCVILFAVGAHPRFPLIVAANRDEAYARPAAQAEFWQDPPHVYGGRDLERGGTWLGLALNGRFAAITNYRQGHHGKAPRSRGDLTRDYLAGIAEPLHYLRGAEERCRQYRGFSLIAGTVYGLYFYSNRSHGIQAIEPGVHGLSNRLLDEPWPKVKRGVAVLTSLLESSETDITQALLALLRDRTPAPDHLLPSTGIALERERALSAAFIAGDTYGTRASTVLLVSQDGEVLYCERSFGPHGTPLGSVDRRFQLNDASRVSARMPAAAPLSGAGYQPP